MIALLRSLNKAMLMALAISGLVYPGSAWAYIDPNAGGVLFQLLLPVLAAIGGGWMFLRRAIAATLRRLWRRIFGHRPDGT